MDGTPKPLDEKRRLLLELLLREEDAGQSPRAITPRDGDAGPPPLSFAQQRLWFLHQLDPQSPLYNEPFAFRLAGPLELAALRESLNAIVRRHEVLRTAFPASDGDPVQVVAPRLTLRPALADLRDLPAGEREAAARQRMAEEARQPFDLAAGPLLRVTVYRLGEEEHLLLFVMHHIICDAWSNGLFFRELGLLYEAFTAGKESPLPALSVQYADFALWQRGWLQGEVLERQLAYWRKQLSGDLPALQLPTNRPRAAVQTHEGARLSFTVSPAVTEALKAVGQREKATQFMTLLAAFYALLHRYAGQEQLVVGSPIAGRNRPELEGLIGFFVNMLALRTDLAGDPSFRELLRRVRRVTLDAYTHQDLPFEKLLGELNPDRDLSRTPLFQVMFVFHDGAGAGLRLPGLTVAPAEVHAQVAKFDLTMELLEGPEGLASWLEYSTDLFDPATATRMAEHFQTLLAGVARNPDLRLSELPILPEAERRQVLTAWNETRADYPRDRCIHHLIEEQAERTPDAVAVVFVDRQLAFGELNRRANQLAHRLRRLGVGPEKLVGVCLERSPEMIVALLGTLKAGGAYLPVDPSYPPERRRLMLEDAEVSVLLTQGRLKGSLPAGSAPVVCLDTDWESISQESDANPAGGAGPETLAYVIYTSGSTGKPKGVMVCHRNVVNFFTGMDERVGCSETDALLAVTSISFDISVLELFWTLARGAKVVLLSEEGLTAPARTQAQAESDPMDFSLFYFASAAEGQGGGKYRLLVEGAKFADQHGFAAVWTPERHFHPFGGLYPNPSVTSAALALVTERVQLRAGSVVLPLHHPVRVAEEWAVVDNLSGGRVGLAFASGWHADDFIFAPGNFPHRKEATLQGIDTVQKLWRGGSVTVQNGAGSEIEVRIYPQPFQQDLPIWLTCGGHPDTFVEAGKIGANVLTHLLGQSPEELAEKIRLYRQSLAKNGHDPARGRVALMLHTFIGEEMEQVLETVRKPFTDYLRSSVGLIGNLARSLDLGLDMENIAPEDMEAVLAHAFERYVRTSALIGTPDSCLATIRRLKALGVDEVACLIDFGVDAEAVLESLSHLDGLRRRSALPARDHSLQGSIAAHGVTLMQCTPSLMRLLLSDGRADALRPLRALLLGGEALPTGLAGEVRRTLPARLLNMYGPTETTIWSATHEVDAVGGTVPIGRPIANTRICILDRNLQPVPPGVQGDLYIGGAGVARGYLRRPELTAEQFIPDPFGPEPSARLYRTGDVARHLPDGTIEFLGRSDHQVKIRGFRIELGEIETALNEHPAVQEAVVDAPADGAGNRHLAAYVVPVRGEGVAAADLRAFLKERLPAYMVPGHLLFLEALPLTANGKLDRRRLPAPGAPGALEGEGYVAPRTQTEQAMAQIWAAVLGVERVGIHDNFLELGGDSIGAIQVVARTNQAGIRLTLKQLFQYLTIAALSAEVGESPGAVAEQGLITGPVPLTPSQRRFFEQQLPDPHHWGQAALFELREPIDAAALEMALWHLLNHHDGLRLRYRCGESGWQQVSGGPGGGLPFERADLSGLPEDEQAAALEAAAAKARSSLDLTAGPLIRAVLFELGPGRPDRLLIVLHQFVADTLSRRILLEDLETLCRQLSAGQPARLPAKTASIRQWAKRLVERAASAEVLAEAGYWTSPARARALPLPVDFPGGENVEGSARSVVAALTPEETRILLQEAPGLFRAEVDELLIAALARAAGPWAGSRTLLVDVEGPGRERTGNGLDLSRTVGCLAAAAPACLELPDAAGLSEHVRSVREQLRRMPNRGAGYGLLRSLGGDPAVAEQLRALPQADIAFRYRDGAEPESRLFVPADRAWAAARSPRNPRPHLLDVTASRAGEALTVSWTYSQNLHRQETVAALADRFMDTLRLLIADCHSPAAAGYAPANFPAIKLDRRTLEKLIRKLR